MDTAGLEEKRKNAKIMEEPSDRLHEKQKRRCYGTHTFGTWKMAPSCIDPNNIKIVKFSDAYVC